MSDRAPLGTEQSTLGGGALDALALDKKTTDCMYHDEASGPCGRYAKVAVTTPDGNVIYACSYHAKESWLDAATGAESCDG